jgi:hypothetical protein
MPVAERLPIADFPDRPRTVVVESFPTRWWRRHAYILPSFLICIVTWSWFVTWGDWKFFEPEDFCGFYDALAMFHATQSALKRSRSKAKPTDILELARRCCVFHGSSFSRTWMDYGAAS